MYTINLSYLLPEGILILCTFLAAEKVAYLLGINSTDLVRSLLRPRIKVGSEYVMKGRNLQQVLWLSHILYHSIQHTSIVLLGGVFHWSSFQEFVRTHVQVAGNSC